MKQGNRVSPLTRASLLLMALSVTSFNGSGQLASPNLINGYGQSGDHNSNSLVYADFENAQENRPVSKRGGFIQLIAFSESPARPSHIKGAAQATPPAPELVRLQKDNPNRAAAFDYELQAPNQYAGVGLEVQGQPEKDGKTLADDVSAYKFLSMQVYATGVPSLRVEFQSRGQGVKIIGAPPQAAFRIKSGFNTYRIPLNSLAQPSWVEGKINPKDVLRKLTSISLVAFCDNCTQINGTVVVDNITFEN